MKKKLKPTAVSQATELDAIRNSSHYKGARSWLGMPFMIAGVINLIGALSFLVGMFDGGLNTFTLISFAGLLIAGLFCFGVSALGSALFDMADCAINNSIRAKTADAKDAYQAFRAAQELSYTDRG